jgi:hypothetical protein
MRIPLAAALSSVLLFNSIARADSILYGGNGGRTFESKSRRFQIDTEKRPAVPIHQKYLNPQLDLSLSVGNRPPEGFTSREMPCASVGF